MARTSFTEFTFHITHRTLPRAEHTHMRRRKEAGKGEECRHSSQTDNSSSALITICATLSKGAALLSTLQSTVRVTIVPESQDYCKDLIR